MILREDILLCMVPVLCIYDTGTVYVGTGVVYVWYRYCICMVSVLCMYGTGAVYVWYLYCVWYCVAVAGATSNIFL